MVVFSSQAIDFRFVRQISVLYSVSVGWAKYIKPTDILLRRHSPLDGVRDEHIGVCNAKAARIRQWRWSLWCVLFLEYTHAHMLLDSELLY